MKVSIFQYFYSILLKYDRLTSLRMSQYLKYRIGTFVENNIEEHSESIFKSSTVPRNS